MNKETLLQALVTRFPCVEGRPEAQLAEVKVPLAEFRGLMQALHDDADWGFDYPMSQTAVDRPGEGKLVSVYHLYSSAHRHSLVVKVDLDRAAPVVPTVSDLWLGCGWFERETFDLFGIRFEGHPDLRRIMLTDDWVGWPLRKDYEDSRMVPRPNY